VSSRVFLFELLCFVGDLDRAQKQLDVIGHQSTEMEIGAEIYRQVLTAEGSRRAVFAEGQLPNFLTTPPDYVALYLEALTMQREQQPAKARALLEKALNLRPLIPGQTDGRPFKEFEDADTFLAPFLELIVNEKYAWLPFEEIRRIEIAKPAQLRDLVWTRAKLEAHGGNLGDVFIPALYPGSSQHPNDAVRLGRMTEWMDVGEGLARGVGQRLFLMDGDERAMLEITEVHFADVVQEATV
jgi:type VI secretion system protein ImpE